MKKVSEKISVRKLEDYLRESSDKPLGLLYSEDGELKYFDLSSGIDTSLTEISNDIFDVVVHNKDVFYEDGTKVFSLFGDFKFELRSDYIYRLFSDGRRLLDMGKSGLFDTLNNKANLAK